MTQLEQAPMTGRIALVTGASGGIGGALALRLAGAGADLALTYSGHRQAADGVAEQIRALGRRAVVLAADLTDPTVAAGLVDQVGTQLGPLDVLVANAGTGRQLSWDDDALDVATWDATM